MTGYEVRQRQDRQFHDVIKLVMRSQTAPLHDVVKAAVARGPDLTFELLQIAFSDWSQFRLESQPVIDDMLMRALKARAA